MYRAVRPLTALDAATRHDVWLCDSRGYRVGLLNDAVSLSYSLSIKDTGGITLEMPYSYASKIKDLALVEVWRRIGERESSFVEVFVIVSKPQALGAKGSRFLTLSGPTLTGYVVSDKRIVQALPLPSAAGASASAPSQRTGALDDVFKQYARDALTEWDASSQGRSLAAGLRLTVAANQGQGARRRVTASLTPLTSVAQDIQAQSEQSSYVARKMYYRVRVTGFDPLTCVLETVMDRRGAYRGLTSAAPVVLSQERGTLGALDLEMDRGSEFASLLVKYTASGATRLTRLTDTTRQRVTPYAHREGFYSATATTKSGAEAEAQFRLRAGKPRRLARLTPTPSAVLRYGADYHLGDVVVVEAFGRQWEAEVVAESSSVQGPLWTPQLRLDEWGV
jgi:hypothetical protein